MWQRRGCCSILKSKRLRASCTGREGATDEIRQKVYGTCVRKYEYGGTLIPPNKNWFIRQGLRGVLPTKYKGQKRKCLKCVITPRSHQIFEQRKEKSWTRANLARWIFSSPTNLKNGSQMNIWCIGFDSLPGGPRWTLWWEGSIPSLF